MLAKALLSRLSKSTAKPLTDRLVWAKSSKLKPVVKLLTNMYAKVAGDVEIRGKVLCKKMMGWLVSSLLKLVAKPSPKC